ncbi:hypothetical protein FRC05_002381 [Tulasnella sp. 425]|nr:hypothetical protein FRC05_002381 [Tulasnella sp. 425]
MHAGSNGREPLKGLTFERSIPQWEFAKDQASALQNWAIGFYNAPGASVFGGVWADPNQPIWNDNLKFPHGTVVFKLLFTTATDEEVPTMKGSPTWQAVCAFIYILDYFGVSYNLKVICPQPDPAHAPDNGLVRNDHASPVRLIQVDWATVDERSPIGWVFGTYMYNGYLENITDPWDRLTSVGVTWGNDPQLNQAAVDRGEKPVESWINPEAEKLRLDLGGKRPSWGYNGRLNGPADNFVSACASCHGTAQSYDAPLVQPGHLDKDTNEWIPLNQRLTMDWFGNIKAGETFSVRGALSADYSLQFTIGWNNYRNWRKTHKDQDKEPDPKKKILLALPTRRIIFRPKPEDEDNEQLQKLLKGIRVEEEPRRAGPQFEWKR